MKSKSYAIVLAWPETTCKCPNSWYDGLCEIINISHNHYYKVGHAAIVLIDPNSGQCMYFDFGRYHAPYGFGRVRSIKTDPELKILTRAKFNTSHQVENLSCIIEEISASNRWHGVGQVFASITSINYNKALKEAVHLQNKVFIPYGPFILNGTNCSRFVRHILLKSATNYLVKVKLMFPISISPTPMTNVLAVNTHLYTNCKNKILHISKTYMKTYRVENTSSERHSISSKNISEVFKTLARKNELYQKMKQVLPKPDKYIINHPHAKWHSGEGAGSWFLIQKLSDYQYLVTRYSPEGQIEFEGSFKTSEALNLENISLTYPSHGLLLSLNENGIKQIFSIESIPIFTELQLKGTSLLPLQKEITAYRISD